MAEYTNSGLVNYCKTALKMKTVYMWGGLFRQVTDAYIKQLAAMYPRQYPTERQRALKGLIGKGYYGCDCIGLIKSYYFGGMGVEKNAKGYDGSKDFGVGGMYNAAKIKGKIASMPKKEGVLVMTSDFGHVGVYIGKNEVVECTLSKFGDGVVKTRLSDRSWAYWCQCPFLTDDTGIETAISSSAATTAQYSIVNSIYRSVGVAAIRNKPTLNGTTVSKRCVKGDYYLADRLYLPDGNGQKWFRHAGKEVYSALTDTNGAALFEFCGTYTKAKSNAVVNIRSAPTLSGNKVARLTAGVVVYATGKTTSADGITWVQVVYNGELCWCDRKWIDC